MTDSVCNRVIQVVNDVFELPYGIDILDVSITRDLAPTSLDQMTLFIALEDEFQKQIPQQEIEGIDTVREIVRYIEHRMATME